MNRHFPIMSSVLMDNVPWDFIAPHEAQALRNHSQTLKRLAERGGLNAAEALDVVEGRPHGSTPRRADAELPLINKVREWRAAIASTGSTTP
jgi:hypothetical protein